VGFTLLLENNPPESMTYPATRLLTYKDKRTLEAKEKEILKAEGSRSSMS